MIGVERAQAAVVMLGGAAGALARTGLAETLPRAAGEWPWATFAANLTGTAVLAWLAVAVAPTSLWRLLAGVGFCGALTTFSTFQVETIRLAREGSAVLAVTYPVVSIAAGMALAYGVTRLAR